MLSLIDIGANLTNSSFDKDLEDVLVRAKTNGVHNMIVTGTSLTASWKALELTQRHPDSILSTAGVHPHHASEWNETVANEITEILANPSVLAVGECGLDFNRNFSPPDQQLICYESQLSLATKIRKPVFLHQRDAHDDVVTILKKYRNDLTGGVLHCFTGDTQQAQDYLDLGCYIGITGWLCDERRGHDLREAVKSIPPDRLMIETDSPYLLPRTINPRPKSNRNEPANLTHVLTALANILNQKAEVLAATLTQNTRTFFGLN